MMDGYFGYDLILITEEDIHKIAFKCPGSIGTYEWVMMHAKLKGVGATYLKVMNTICHDFIGHNLEVYIDDMLIKSTEIKAHLNDLQ